VTYEPTEADLACLRKHLPGLPDWKARTMLDRLRAAGWVPPEPPRWEPTEDEVLGLVAAGWTPPPRDLRDPGRPLGPRELDDAIRAWRATRDGCAAGGDVGRRVRAEHYVDALQALRVSWWGSTLEREADPL